MTRTADETTSASGPTGRTTLANPRRTRRERASAVCAVAVLAVGALSGTASAAPAGDPVLDFEGKSGIRALGLHCSAVPLSDGGTLPLGMVVTSDSSKRTASVQYVQTFHGGPPLFWSTGRITVLAATHRYVATSEDGSWQLVDGSAQRPGPAGAERASCEYSGYSGGGHMELVHLTAARPPSAAALAAWCAAWSPESAATYRPAGMCGD